MPERVVQVGDLELWTEDFGDPSDPTILLNAGGGAPGIIWSEAFCQDVASAGRRVIRYDYRDTGLSSTVDFEVSPYTISDLTADAVGVLDAYDVRRAHFVGWSQGGCIAQTAGFEHPDRVASVVTISSTPLRGSVHSGGDGNLPGVSEEFQKAGVALMTAADNEEWVDRLVASIKAGGITEPLDEQELRSFAKRAIGRGGKTEKVVNHVMALVATPECREELSRITAPTLVIHGANDRAISVAHGQATVDAIPGAKLLVIEGMGHVPRPEPPEMLAAIIEHSA
jgi:pimeloyl-ACP methyl ester carboxylesterase